MYAQPGLGRSIDLSDVRRAVGLPAITARNVAAPILEAQGGAAGRAAAAVLRAGGGAKEAAVAALRETPQGQDAEREWARQRVNEVAQTAMRYGAYAGLAYLIYRAVR